MRFLPSVRSRWMYIGQVLDLIGLVNRGLFYYLAKKGPMQEILSGQ